MSSVILTNWTVYYADDAGAGAGMKQIKWTGSGGPETDTNTVNELYSALADLFSIAAQNNADDTIPIRAVTPSVYEIGAFDAGDLEPWFIDPISVQHLTGGSLETVGWTRNPLPGDGTGDIGILKITRSGSTNIVDGDIGATITNSTGNDDGWLLHIDGDDLWIRPDTNALADDWNTTGGSNDLVCNGHTDTQLTAGVTGEREWPNIYSLGTISDGTRLSVFQSFAEISNFWGDGHIDRLILTNDGFDAGLIDRGQLTIFARQYSQLYDHFIIDVSSGGRNPIPLSTSDDINNNSGYGSIVLTGSSGTWNTGNFIYYDNGGTLTWTTTTKKGVITSGGSGGTPTLEYYLIGDLTDFAASEDVTEYDPATGADGDANGAINGSAPTAVGPANPASAYTFDFGASEEDIGDGNGNQPYDVTINLGGNTLSDFYQYTKYITRRGNTSDLDPGGDQVVDGEEYLTAGDVRLTYDTDTVAFLEGAILTGQVSGATGVITADHTTDNVLIVRDVRGTFLDDENILDNQGTPGNADIILTGGIEYTTISKTAPFGTYAGGNFFGARGVWITNMHANDANSYELVDSLGEPHSPPLTVPIAITAKDTDNSAIENAQVYVQKEAADPDYGHPGNPYTDPGTATNQRGDTSYVVSEAIESDNPSSGWIKVQDVSTNEEHIYRYASWATSTFTLNTEVTGTDNGTGDETTINETNIGTKDIVIGDTIRMSNSPFNWAIVLSVSTNSVTTTALSGADSWASEPYSVHTLAVDYVSGDYASVPLILDFTNASGVVSLSYSYGGDKNIDINVRKSSTGDTRYRPLKTVGGITNTGFSVTVVMTVDPIAT